MHRATCRRTGRESRHRRIEDGAVRPLVARTYALREIAEALKIFGKPISIVSDYCQTGTDAFRCGVMSVACGLYDTVLVVGYDKPKDRGVSGPSVMMTQVRDLPQTPAGWFSLCAARYFDTYDTGREDLAKIAPGVKVRIEGAGASGQSGADGIAKLALPAAAYLLLPSRSGKQSSWAEAGSITSLPNNKSYFFRAVPSWPT